MSLSRVVLTHTTPRVVAFDMKKTLDSFMDSVSQKQLSEAQSKALSDRFNKRWSRAWPTIRKRIMS
jgi:conjugal transfer pilin signal peptidase TrbI